MKQRPNVLFVADSLEGGGAERARADMASYWAGKDWCVTLVTLKYSDALDFYSIATNVSRVRLGVKSSNSSFLAKVRSSISCILRLRRQFRLTQPDAVLSFIDVPNVLTILGLMGLGMRTVVSERGCPDKDSQMGYQAWSYTLSRPWQLLRRLVYGRADAVTALNHHTAEWLSKECRVQVKVIPNGIRALPTCSYERGTEIVAAGRLHAVKGFDVLIDAFARISADFPAWRLVIIGDGIENSALHALRDDLSLSDKIAFEPPQKDIEMRFARAGLVVAPSRSEAFGNVILESMAMGAAVISTTCAGPMSMIEDGVNGRLVPVGNAVVLSDVMAELMSQPEQRARLGREAEKVRRQFAQESMMELREDCLVPEYGRTQTSDLDMVGDSIERQ